MSAEQLGPDHPDTATSLNNLGFLLQALGDLTGAHPYYERALVIREKVLGPDHPNTATSVNNLRLLLQAQGDFAAARPYYERALAIQQARGDRYGEGVSFYQLGNLAIQLGHVDEGAGLLAVCLLIDQEIGHADSEQDLRNLTTITEQLGYSQEQLDELVDVAKEAYRTDRGRGLLRAAFAPLDAESGA